MLSRDGRLRPSLLVVLTQRPRPQSPAPPSLLAKLTVCALSDAQSAQKRPRPALSLPGEGKQADRFTGHTAALRPALAVPSWLRWPGFRGPGQGGHFARYESPAGPRPVRRRRHTPPRSCSQRREDVPSQGAGRPGARPAGRSTGRAVAAPRVPAPPAPYSTPVITKFCCDSCHAMVTVSAGVGKPSNA